MLPGKRSKLRASEALDPTILKLDSSVNFPSGLVPLVDDLRAAVQAVEETGALVAMPPTEIPGQGTFAIYLLGGIEHGLWEN